MTKTIEVKSVARHAQQRVAERLGKPIEHAPNYLRQLMETAEYRSQRIGKHGDKCYTYVHPKTGVHIVVSEQGTIITCYEDGNAIDPIAVEVGPAELPPEISAAIRRKAGALVRKYTKETRHLDRQIAEHELRLAQLKLNQLRVHNPATKRAIADSMTLVDEVVRNLTAHRAEIAGKLDGVRAHV